jgi:hypothetical protein
MAAALTGRLIERVSLYEPAAVCRSLREHTLALRGLAKGLPREHSREILSCSVTLVLKMLETRTLSGADVPRALGSVVASARALFPGA